ncbi:MAG TPA: DUF58 domain-containing protein [Actinomycetota bacterium]|nr:DUF58 domain-containing protein [Actinomycetota bacterium]
MTSFSPSPRAAAAIALLALTCLIVPLWIPALAALALAVATFLDARSVGAAPELTERFPQIVSRGIPASFELAADAPDARQIWLDQAAPVDVEVTPRGGGPRLSGTLTARRRGRHLLPPTGERSEGPLGLGRRHHRYEPHEVLVYPDLPAARRIATAVRRGRFREAGRVMRGPLGLGTDFESIRDYLPDDDIRQVNWIASIRTGKPMSNQYRVEQDRDVMCVVDSGRLMAAPAGDRTRLDAAMDAVTAVAAVANVVGDRCGAIAFDDEVIRHVEPRRAGGDDVVRALFDIEASDSESDYELAFRTVSGGKRSLMVVFTDIVEDAAARPLVDAIPVIARRHAVIVASVLDPELRTLLTNPPDDVDDVYALSVALDVASARTRVAARLRQAGATVVEGLPEDLASVAVGAYLRAKSRGRT